MFRALVDPNVAAVRGPPREEGDLFIAGNNGHLLAFDNLSDLSPWTSDALCRLASGGSFAVRQLYTDNEEVLFQAARGSSSMEPKTSSPGPTLPIGQSLSRCRTSQNITDGLRRRCGAT